MGKSLVLCRPELTKFQDEREQRAAQYVRASTKHQRYSTQNQAVAIAAYAARNNLAIVRTYADEGRSGLKIDNREGLRELISDVRASVECQISSGVSCGNVAEAPRIDLS